MGARRLDAQGLGKIVDALREFIAARLSRPRNGGSADRSNGQVTRQGGSRMRLGAVITNSADSRGPFDVPNSKG